MIGIKEFFKYFWKYFTSKGCVVKWVVIIVAGIPLPLALVASIMAFEGESIWVKIGGFIYVEAMAISPFVPIIAIILGRRLAKFRKEVDKLSYNDLKNKKEYYRDFLENYSPAVLSYIDDFYVGEEAIVATVLNLQLKRKVSITPGGIQVISSDDSNLDSNEKYVLSSIINKFFNSKNMLSTFQQYTKNDVYAHRLLEEQKVKRQGIIRSLIKGTLVFIGMTLLLSLIMNVMFEVFDDFSYSGGLEEFLCMIFMVPIMLMGVVYLMYPLASISYLIFAYRQTFKETTLYRSDKAEKINENIEGLKNFLKDYTLLSQREQHEIALWDKYLVYSVMFGQNKGIVKDFEKFYN